MQPFDTFEPQNSLTDKPATETSSNQYAEKKSPTGRISHRLNKVVAALVVIAIIGVSLLLFKTYRPSSSSSINSSSSGSAIGAVGTPITSHVQAGGLEFNMDITPGPYFLSELFVADMTLTNHTQTTFTLEGPSNSEPCGSALYLAMTGGTAPNYNILPVSAVHSCPYMQTTFKPGDTLTFHQYTPLLSSGDITLTPGATFLQTQMENGVQVTSPGKSPLDGHWPSINIHVNSLVPIDRKITLQQEGTQVQINAPASARAHLYYIYNVACDAFQGGTVGTGSFAWEHITVTTLHEPDCGDYGNKNIYWYYGVSSPGYAIVSGQHHTG
jgi:hypothetical protein